MGHQREFRLREQSYQHALRHVVSAVLSRHECTILIIADFDIATHLSTQLPVQLVAYQRISFVCA
jgi:hypothetical protein